MQEHGEKLIQFFTEINVVTLPELAETIPLQMHVVIKANGGPRNIGVCFLFCFVCLLDFLAFPNMIILTT